MRIAVMGSGGVGGYVGGRLAASGQDVTFLARGAHLAAIRDHGLALRSALGDVLIQPAKVSDDPAGVGPVDVVIFAVKLYDTEAAAAATRPLIGADTGGAHLAERRRQHRHARARARRRARDRRGGAHRIGRSPSRA